MQKQWRSWNISHGRVPRHLEGEACRDEGVSAQSGYRTAPVYL